MFEVELKVFQRFIDAERTGNENRFKANQTNTRQELSLVFLSALVRFGSAKVNRSFVDLLAFSKYRMKASTKTFLLGREGRIDCYVRCQAFNA